MNANLRVFSVADVDHEIFDCWLDHTESFDFPLLGTRRFAGSPAAISESFSSYQVADPAKIGFPTVRLATLRDGHWIAGASCTIYPGRFARIRCRNDSDIEVGTGVLEAIREACLDRFANFLAIYFEAGESQQQEIRRCEQDWLQKAGFQNLGIMYLMELTVSNARSFRNERESFDSTLTLDSMKMEATQENIDLVNATYQDSLDCADITSLRSTEDILQSYRTNHSASRNSWFRIVSSQSNHAVACLLLSEINANLVEISYLGVVPNDRRRGVGRFCLQSAVDYAKGVGASKLRLAVHEKNIPAIQLYRSFGFEEIAAHDIWFWSTQMSPNQ